MKKGSCEGEPIDVSNPDVVLNDLKQHGFNAAIRERVEERDGKLITVKDIVMVDEIDGQKRVKPFILGFSS